MAERYLLGAIRRLPKRRRKRLDGYMHDKDLLPELRFWVANKGVAACDGELRPAGGRGRRMNRRPCECRNSSPNCAAATSSMAGLNASCGGWLWSRRSPEPCCRCSRRRRGSRGGGRAGDRLRSAMVVVWAFGFCATGPTRTPCRSASESSRRALACNGCVPYDHRVVLAFAPGAISRSTSSCTAPPTGRDRSGGEEGGRGDTSGSGGDGGERRTRSIAVLPLVTKAATRISEYFSDNPDRRHDQRTLIPVRQPPAGDRAHVPRFPVPRRQRCHIGEAGCGLLTGSVRKLGITTVRINARSGEGMMAAAWSWYADLFRSCRTRSWLRSPKRRPLKAKLLQGGNPVAQNVMRPLVTQPPRRHSAYQQGRFYAVRVQPAGRCSRRWSTSAKPFASIPATRRPARSRSATRLARLAVITHTGAEVAPRQRRRRAIDAALRLNPDIAQAHAARAIPDAGARKPTDGSLAEYRMSGLAPNDPRIVVASRQALPLQGQIEAPSTMCARRFSARPAAGEQPSLLSTLLASTGRMDARAAIGKDRRVQPRSNSYRRKR